MGLSCLSSTHASLPRYDLSVWLYISCRSPRIIRMRKREIPFGPLFSFCFFFLGFLLWMISEMYYSRKRGLNSLCEAITQLQQLRCMCLPLSPSTFLHSDPQIQTCSISEPDLCPSLLLLASARRGRWILSVPSQGPVCVLGLHLSLLSLVTGCLCNLHRAR